MLVRFVCEADTSFFTIVNYCLKQTEMYVLITWHLGWNAREREIFCKLSHFCSVHRFWIAFFCANVSNYVGWELPLGIAIWSDEWDLNRHLRWIVIWCEVIRWIEVDVWEFEPEQFSLIFCWFSSIFDDFFRRCSPDFCWFHSQWILSIGRWFVLVLLLFLTIFDDFRWFVSISAIENR